MGQTKVLAKHVAELSFVDVPKKIVCHIKRLVLDWFGIAIAGSTTETGKITAEFVRDLGGKNEATVIGYGYKVPSPNAAFANAVQSHSLELDDADHLALFHYSPPVVSAALAIAEREHADGRAFLTAVIAGCEVMNRISDSVNPSHRDKGFHTTATCGTFGAAVAAGKILNLDWEKMISCLGLAGAQASGLMEFYGVSMQKRINPGFSARNGVTAALLAEKGFTGADTILEGSRGFCIAFSDSCKLGKITSNLGSEFPIYIEFKPYACARPIHTAIDCVLNILKKHRIDVDRIMEIIVMRNPTWANYHLIYVPRSYHEAQVSLPYSVAVALIDGKAFLEQYSEERIRDQYVLDLVQKVKAVPCDVLSRSVSVAVKIRMIDGTEYNYGLDYPKGSAQNPLTDEELKNKFESLALKRLRQDTIQLIAKKIDAIERIKDIHELCDLVYERSAKAKVVK